MIILVYFSQVQYLTRILQCDHARGFARPLANGAAEASLGLRHQNSGQEEKRCQHPHGDLAVICKCGTTFVLVSDDHNNLVFPGKVINSNYLLPFSSSANAHYGRLLYFVSVGAELNLDLDGQVTYSVK